MMHAAAAIVLLAIMPQPLPSAPQSTAKAVHKPLLPDGTLILETRPDETRRLLLAAEVCLRDGPLELLLCKYQSKEHEALLRTRVDARFVHAALEACGAKPGKPVQFVDPQTGKEDYKPASGIVIEVSVHYYLAGRLRTVPAQQWIREIQTRKPMTATWVFAGSRLINNPDRPNDPPVYTADLGDVISISNKLDAMLELPIKSTDADADLLYEANTRMIPPIGSKVWLILEPVRDKK